MKKILRPLKKAVYFCLRLKNKNKNKQKIVKFKKEIWQTDEVSKSFIDGSNASLIPVADNMDREVNEFFLSQCTKEDKILDIGCGHGIVSEFLAEKGLDVTAIDISEKLLTEFRNRIKDKDLKIEIKQGDAYSIPCVNEEFDVVVARMFLPHFPDWPIVLKEMTRVTKKGGKLLVHFPSKENTDFAKKIKITDYEFLANSETNDPRNFYAETDDKELKRVCKKNGLTLINRTPVSFFQDNRILANQLGGELHYKYMTKMENYLKNEEVKNFILWFDKEIIAHCHPALSRSNIIEFKKHN